jgi:protein SCO1
MIFHQRHSLFRRSLTAVSLTALLGLGVALAGSPEKGSCCRADSAEAAAGSAASASSRAPVDIPDATLVRMDGTRISLRQELDCGKPVMLNFVFTTCTTICPVMSAAFAQVQTALGDDRDQVRMVSISIDPEHDTPARLRDYAAARNAGPEWHFLTGEPATIETVQRAFGAFRGAKSNHAPLTFMRRPGDDRWVRLEGLRSAEELALEYRRMVDAR